MWSCAVCVQLWHRTLVRTDGVETSSFSVVVAEARPSLDAFINCVRGQQKSVSQGQLEMRKRSYMGKIEHKRRT